MWGLPDNSLLLGTTDGKISEVRGDGVSLVYPQYNISLPKHEFEYILIAQFGMPKLEIELQFMKHPFRFMRI